MTFPIVVIFVVALIGSTFLVTWACVRAGAQAERRWNEHVDSAMNLSSSRHPSRWGGETPVEDRADYP